MSHSVHLRVRGALTCALVAKFRECRVYQLNALYVLSHAAAAAAAAAAASYVLCSTPPELIGTWVLTVRAHSFAQEMRKF
jgi:hypothetical protein